MTLPQDKKSKTGRVVLLVDDDEAILTTIKDILEMAGFSVISAENGEQALQKLDQFGRPCLILLDLMMPIMNGIQFLEAMQRVEAFNGIPVVIVSAFSENAKDVGGYVGMLRKPFELDHLLKTVGHYCN